MIRDGVANSKMHVVVDLSSVEEFSSGATLVFLAELSRIFDISPQASISGVAPNGNRGRQVIKQVGIAELLGIDMSDEVDVDRDDVKHWRCARSVRGQGADGEKYENIMHHYEGVVAEALDSDLYTGITEAMTNANHHAYFMQRGDEFENPEDYKPWWMFSQEKAGRLTVVFCDLGSGIAKTLPYKRPEIWDRVRNMLAGRNMDEGKVIQEAVEHSRTRTSKEYRGKGLRQIVETLKGISDSKVMIFSGHGVYRLSGGRERNYHYAGDILGTVILWSMPLPKGAK